MNSSRLDVYIELQEEIIRLIKILYINNIKDSIILDYIEKTQSIDFSTDIDQYKRNIIIRDENVSDKKMISLLKIIETINNLLEAVSKNNYQKILDKPEML